MINLFFPLTKVQAHIYISISECSSEIFCSILKPIDIFRSDTFSTWIPFQHTNWLLTIFESLEDLCNFFVCESYVSSRNISVLFWLASWLHALVIISFIESLLLSFSSSLSVAIYKRCNGLTSLLLVRCKICF